MQGAAIGDSTPGLADRRWLHCSLVMTLNRRRACLLCEAGQYAPCVIKFKLMAQKICQTYKNTTNRRCFCCKWSVLPDTGNQPWLVVAVLALHAPAFTE